jgi:membrane peptidoglycan carboxypeptidase
VFYRLHVTSTRLALACVAAAVLVATAMMALPQTDGEFIAGIATLDVYAQGMAPFAVPTLPEHSVLLDAGGQPIATFYYQNRIDVHLNEVAKIVTAALISSEDRTFYTNDGFDPKSIARAAFNNLMGQAVQGGSTITQQYVKNLTEIVTGVAPAETISRKLHEIAYARQLTAELTKAQILDGYLNTVYFGEDAYGIQAAALRYYSVPAAALDLNQAAMLVALVRNPGGYDPILDPTTARHARNQVLAAMVVNHAITRARAVLTRALPLDLKVSPVPADGCGSSPDPYFCEWAWNQVRTLPQLGATDAQRVAALDNGGYIIRTTLNVADQRAAQTAASSKVGPADRVGAALVSITPGTGAVVAMAQNRVWGLDVKKNQTEVNYATSGSPVGSAFKAFTLATALSQGLTASLVLPAGSAYRSSVLANPAQGFYSNAEPWSASHISLATATADSVNTAFVQLEEKVGVKNIARTAHRMGLLSLPLTGPLAPQANEGSLTLGARSFSPLEMASAYATLGDSGRYCTPMAITSITDRTGKVTRIDPTCRQAIPPAVASGVTELLYNVVAYGTGTGAGVPGQHIAGKTGTTQGFGSAWFVGYTPKLVTASWMGDPKGPTFPLYNVDGVSAVYGGTLPASMFATVMNQELNGNPVTNPVQVLSSSPVTVPELSGLSGPLAKSRLESLGLRLAGVLPVVVGQSIPVAGTIVNPNSTVALTPRTS